MHEHAAQTAAHSVGAELVANDFVNEWEGKLDPQKLDELVNSIQASPATEAYAADGSVVSTIFYLQFELHLWSNGKTFNGKAFGWTSPGSGALWGTFYTDDIDRLMRDTKTFAVQSTAMYTAIQFIDSHDDYLGTFQGGSLSTVVGACGGSGGWS